jgi:hypothetical protein
MKMRITAEKIEKLTQEAKEELLVKIVNGVINLDLKNENETQAVDFILYCILDNLDAADEDDGFGTEGWRRSILDED